MQWHITHVCVPIQTCNGVLHTRVYPFKHAMAYYTRTCTRSNMQWRITHARVPVQTCNGVLHTRCTRSNMQRCITHARVPIQTCNGILHTHVYPFKHAMTYYTRACTRSNMQWCITHALYPFKHAKVYYTRACTRSNMQWCIHTCVCAHSNMQRRIIHARVPVQTCKGVYTHVCVPIQTCKGVYTHVCVPIQTCKGVYTHVCVCVPIQTCKGVLGVLTDAPSKLKKWYCSDTLKLPGENTGVCHTYGTFRKIVPVLLLLHVLKTVWPFVFRSVLLPFSVSFLLPLAFKRYRLASVFLVTCNTYVLDSYVHRRDSDKTYASCWLARVTRSRWLYTTTARASNRAIYRENCGRRESRQPDEESPSS